MKCSLDSSIVVPNRSPSRCIRSVWTPDLDCRTDRRLDSWRRPGAPSRRLSSDRAPDRSPRCVGQSNRFVPGAGGDRRFPLHRRPYGQGQRRRTASDSHSPGSCVWPCLRRRAQDRHNKEGRYAFEQGAEPRPHSRTAKRPRDTTATRRTAEEPPGHTPTHRSSAH